MSASFEKMSSSVMLHLSTFHLFQHRPVMSVDIVSVFTLSPLCCDVVCNAFVSRTDTLIWCFSVSLQWSPWFLHLFIEKSPHVWLQRFWFVHFMSIIDVFAMYSTCFEESFCFFFEGCQSWWRSKATHRSFQSVMSSFNSTLRLNSIQSKLRCETLVWHR